MKQILICVWLGAALVIIPVSTAAAGPARAQLSNNSIRMYPGDCSCGGGLDFIMSFSSFFTEDPAQANGELAPLPQPATRTHRTYLVLEDISMVASASYAELDLPMADVNGNGTPDFFEVDRAVSASSSGTYAVIWDPGYGQLLFQWTRSAGSPRGSCLLTLTDPILGPMGPFTHTFELTNYTGELSYTPGSNNVTGTISLARAGQASAAMEGAISLVKAPTNRFNQLMLAGGNWTNQTEVFAFGDCELTRDPAHPTLYQATLQNAGGAYGSWKLSIVDTNDANGNGIPDFSDDVATVTPPRRPMLSLSSAQTHLLLSVSGDVGRTHLVQEATSPHSTDWNTVQNLTLTNDPQVVTLPLPTSSPTFWRVEAR
jgi:hypothetical protein